MIENIIANVQYKLLSDSEKCPEG